jgi:hypothetical protein
MSSANRFEPIALPGLIDLASSRASESDDLSLDERISAWMRRSQFDSAEALRVMRALRAAILEAAQMDTESEPIPLTGRSTDADLLSWATYLTGLIERTASVGKWDPNLVLESTIRHLAA